MKIVVSIILTISIFALVMATSFCALFMKKQQTIAENVQVTSEWIEIKPEKSLKPTHQVQHVLLLIEGYEHKIGDSDYRKIKLIDGTFVTPEVQIVDENDKVYQLRDGTRLGNTIGFSLNKEIHGTHEFPKDVAYRAIRIRGDKPFRCIKISWYDYDLK